MKKLLYYVEFGVLGMIVWCILYEDMSWSIAATGLALGIIAAVFANSFLVTRQLSAAYRFNLPVLIIILFVMIFRIFKAGISVIPLIITGNAKPGVIDIKTEVPEGLASTALANSITLTPGTVTIDKNGRDLKVLWLNKSTNDPVEAAKIINGPMETLIRKAAKHD
jgi:multicomponent Na+:H+ antiporter subunit E